MKGRGASSRVLCLVGCSSLIYVLNGELLQKLGDGHVSPLLNLYFCHITGVFFMPFLLSRWRDTLRIVVDLRFWTSTMVVSLLLMGYNYLWLMSTEYVPVSVTNLLFQSSIVSSYAASTWMGFTPFRPQGIVGVAMATAGIVHYVTSETESLNLQGVGLALLAAVGYTIYQVTIKTMIPNQGGSPWLWYASLGFTVSIVHLMLTRVVLMLEHPVFPQGEYAFGVAVTAILAFTVNCLGVLILSESTPAIMTAGNACTIPLSFFVDFWWHGYAVTARHVIVATSILISFYLLTAQDIELSSSTGEEVVKPITQRTPIIMIVDEECGYTFESGAVARKKTASCRV